MSTKTSIKRIAIVAVAALTLGLVSTGSANAAWSGLAGGSTSNENLAASVVQDSSTGDGGVGAVAGPANSVTVNIQQKTDSPTTTTYGAYVTVSGAGAYILGASVGTGQTYETQTLTAAKTDTATTVSSNGATAILPGGDTTGVYGIPAFAKLLRALKIATPQAGVVTVSVYSATAKGANPSQYATTADATLSITVLATGISGALNIAASTLYDTSQATAPDSAGSAGTAGLTLNAAVSSSYVGRYLAAFNDANSANLASTTTWSVTMTGPGSIATDSTKTGARAATGTGATPSIYLFGDGTSGTTTLTWYVGTTSVFTRTVKFYSTTVSTLSATVLKKYVGIPVTGYTEPAGTGGTDAYIAVTAKDSSGNSVPSLTTLTATSSNTAVVTTQSVVWDATDLVYYVGLTGVSRGTATITIKDATGTISATADVQVVKAVADKVTITTDKPSYNAGDAVKVQITATTADGDPVADGKYANMIADTMTASIPFGSGTLFDANVNKPSFTSGLAYRTLYAPLFAGTINLTAYLGTSTTVLSTALQTVSAAATAQTASYAVSMPGASGGDASLALDAANAATDAANNAYDEAQNATQAAQDALAAVTALAAQVKSLIASVKSLTALVSKIKAKVGA